MSLLLCSSLNVQTRVSKHIIRITQCLTLHSEQIAYKNVSKGDEKEKKKVG